MKFQSIWNQNQSLFPHTLMKYIALINLILHFPKQSHGRWWRKLASWLCFAVLSMWLQICLQLYLLRTCFAVCCWQGCLWRNTNKKFPPYRTEDRENHSNPLKMKKNTNKDMNWKKDGSKIEFLFANLWKKISFIILYMSDFKNKLSHITILI